MEQEIRQIKQNRLTHRYIKYCAGFVVFLCYALFISSCTKPDNDIHIPVDTLPPPPSGPSGVIQDFTITDSLIGHGKQTNIKWYVDGTNSLTEVRLNGEKVAFSGAMQSGPLSKNTVFTLTINNNKQASKTVYVADSMATLLWNSGIRWKTVETRTETDKVITGSQGQDSTIKVWPSTYDSFNGLYVQFRTSFSLDGSSLEEQLNPAFPKPNPSKKYVVDQVLNAPPGGTGYGMFWKGKVYFIDTLSLSSRELVLRIDSSLSNGKVTSNRIRYIPEL